MWQWTGTLYTIACQAHLSSTHDPLSQTSDVKVWHQEHKKWLSEEEEQQEEAGGGRMEEGGRNTRKEE